ncbi:hypothetical protein NC652_003192 [Populus alba x Populus x berolinensis]|nr:hypothetical protein NC652_003192 [Populus alba x Populus x berolinensis]
MPQGQRRSQQNECQFDRINALDPARKIRSEAGVTEIWDENDQQFQCAAVVVIRHTINQRGLLLRRGFHGAVIPGCPETFQSSGQYSRDRRESSQDYHQKTMVIPLLFLSNFLTLAMLPTSLIRISGNSSWLATHNKKYKAKEAQTREAIMKASSVASMSDYSQKLSTLTPD